jgi:hypothetical protein
MRLYTYHLAPLADALYDRLESDDLRHRGWRFALYRALKGSTLGDDEAVYWKTEYHQWSVDHHYRGSKHSAKSKIAECSIAAIDRLDENRYRIRAVFTDIKGGSQSAACELSSRDFPASLWVAQNVHGDTLLEGSFERDRIFDGLAPRFDRNAPSTDSPVPTEPIDLHPKLTALHAMTEALRPWYAKASAEEQSYLETVVGAAVFYLPQSVDHFGGSISLACLQGCLEDERRVKDHVYPRKRAGRHLLTTSFTATELHDLYHGELARFMYLTPSENSRMVNFYESHEDHDSALEALGIVKFPGAEQEPFHSHTEFREFLKYLIREGLRLEDEDAAVRALEAFRSRG